VYRHTSGEYKGRHVVVIVGYDDATHSFLVKNSWGPRWGEEGYFRIDYDDVSSVGAVVYAIQINRNILPFGFKSSSTIVDLDDLTNYDVQVYSSLQSTLVMQKTINIRNEFLDSTDFPDGIYSVLLRKNGFDQIRGSFFVVQENAPEVQLKLSVEASQKNKTTFALECSQEALIQEVEIEVSNNENFQIEDKTWPCPQIRFTIFHKNWQRPLIAKARAKIGNFEIHSNEVEITERPFQ
jgi:hypothetical protein